MAQDRSYLPEKVPFRLTRMMTNCFELADRHHRALSKSKGNFRKSSNVTMEVLRDSRDIILAMLEAFLYDPLLSWTVGLYLLPLYRLYTRADVAGQSRALRHHGR